MGRTYVDLGPGELLMLEAEAKAHQRDLRDLLVALLVAEWLREYDSSAPFEAQEAPAPKSLEARKP